MVDARRRFIRPRTLQAGLFLAAILAPCLVLVALSVQMVGQDRELAAKRAQDTRRLSAERSRQALLSRLERLKLEVLRGDVGALPGRADDAIALLADIKDARLTFEWDEDPAAPRFARAIAEPVFSQMLAVAQRQEFAASDSRAALATYQRSIAIARSSEQTAAARLGAMRTALGVGRSSEADAQIDELLRTRVSLVDEEGVPVALYAAVAAFRNGSPPGELGKRMVDVIRHVIERQPPVTLPAVHMAKDVVDRLQPLSPADAHLVVLRDRIAVRLGDARMAHELREMYPALRMQLPKDGEAAWLPFGDDDALWLITETRGIESDAPVLVAARAQSVVSGVERVTGTSLILARREGGNIEPLGAGFPGLFVAVPVLPENGYARPFLLVAVVLTLAVALSGGFLFWRDTQRDLRTSALRAQFVASVSHELKTPLTSIRMFAETLRLGRTSPGDADAYLDTILNESERLSRLLDNVLDFSRIEQGRRTYRLEPHALAPIVRSAARTLRYPLEQQGFVLNMRIDDERACAACDPDALEQAILNLLSNAMKYSGNQRTIDLRLSMNGNDCVIAVADRGIGVAPAEQAKIFEKFYRGASAEHQRVAGTGLGLTLVDLTVRAHGGSVCVASEPGRGSTFSIALPSLDCQVAAPRSVGADAALSVGLKS